MFNQLFETPLPQNVRNCIFLTVTCIPVLFCFKTWAWVEIQPNFFSVLIGQK